MEKIWVKIARLSRYTYLRVVRIKAPAESIALGMALGVFAGALPFLSLQMAIAVALAFVLFFGFFIGGLFGLSGLFLVDQPDRKSVV